MALRAIYFQAILLRDPVGTQDVFVWWFEDVRTLDVRLRPRAKLVKLAAISE